MEYNYSEVMRKCSTLIFFIFLLTTTVEGQTISPKRGVAGELLDNSDCSAVDNYLTWFYNWANTPNATVINTHQNYIEFCPMLWNGSWNAAALNTYLSAHPEVDYLLAFNEPNYSVQANMTPAAAAALWPQVEAIANTYNLKIVSPAVGWCSGTCLTGYNNMDGTKWLDDFFAACPGCRVDYIGIHIYDTWHYGFIGNVNPYKKYGKQIWVTEFDRSGAINYTQHAQLMVDVIDYMEQSTDIFRYAWFLSRASSTDPTELFVQPPTIGTLNNLGLIYTNMSSYDKNYWHLVNTQIQAEHYIDKSVTYCAWNGSACTWPYSVLLEKTTDVSGVLDAYNFLSTNDDTIFYNINIPTTQTYTIDFRVSSTSASTIMVKNAAGTLLGTTTSLNTGGAWSTINLSGINLAAGKQKIYLMANNGAPLKLNWFRINCVSNCTLPVDLISFNAHKSSTGVQVMWTTASEKNSQAFIIEKSTDGINFHSIQSIESKGNSSIQNDYSYIDESVSNTEVYYRLKMEDVDGSFSYSSVVSVSFEENEIVLEGNKIISRLISEKEISFIVLNSIGQVIHQENYLASKGVMEKEISLNTSTKGIYLVKIISNDFNFSGKLINQ
jgi:hypothetical protein